ncbi:hypothetical protein [Streptomyces peucetius]|uniref:Uncharacterized protein n=1 Tax=Streptomyces peucetius TaxID=1950 RepID=A0ABY6IGV7_STRPE|nr:hypothetical protein [Streptomyces peucetius]UYQ66245.1 hypothetical protein OGH68_35530 [Streptomyces peucetius]
MTGRSRARLGRVRALLGIAQLALQQVGGHLNADDVDARALAAILGEFQEDIDMPGGLFPMLAQLVSAAARGHRRARLRRARGTTLPGHDSGAA